MGKTVRPRMSEEEYRQYQAFKSSLDSHTSPNDYKPKGVIMSAIGDDGTMMNIDEYCDHYNLPREDISSYKLVSHTGIPFHNVVFKEFVDEVDLEALKEIIESEFSRTYTYTPQDYERASEGVLKWSDLHFGAHIRNLVLTTDYDKDVLFRGLMDSVYDVNILRFKKVHVHINGDLIESFSGMNHINSWQSLDKELVGAKAVIYCCDLLDTVLSEIKNLDKIKIVAGNHDRTSSRNDEDVKGGAAELIAWGLRLKGYDVEFHPYIITHKVEGINHINLHGDKAISKRTTEEILWKYGEKGIFNFIFEGHLHSIIEKLSASRKNSFKTIKDDSIDHRRMHLPSFFTGNYYSETLGFNANAGYVIVWDNGKGKPQLFNATI